MTSLMLNFYLQWLASKNRLEAILLYLFDLSNFAEKFFLSYLKKLQKGIDFIIFI